MEKKQVELRSSEVEMASQHIPQQQRKKGGIVTMPFIIGKLCSTSQRKHGFCSFQILIL